MRSAAGISQESNRRGHAPQRGTVGRILLSRVQRRIRVPAPDEEASADFLKRRNDHAPRPLHTLRVGIRIVVSRLVGLAFLPEGSGDFARRRRRTVGIANGRLFLRDRSAACLVRRVAVLIVRQRVLTYPSSRILRRRRARVLRRKLTAFLLFFLWRFPVADAGHSCAPPL